MDVRKELAGLAFGVVVSVLVGVAASLAGVASLEEVSLASIAATAVRSAASAIVALLGARVPGITH